MSVFDWINLQQESLPGWKKVFSDVYIRRSYKGCFFYQVWVSVVRFEVKRVDSNLVDSKTCRWVLFLNCSSNKLIMVTKTNQQQLLTQHHHRRHRHSMTTKRANNARVGILKLSQQLSSFLYMRLSWNSKLTTLNVKVKFKPHWSPHKYLFIRHY